MTSPVVCACGTLHMDACPGDMTLCLVQGFVFDKSITLTNKLTGAPQDWPAGTSARIRFSWGTGTELTFPVTVDGPYLYVHLTAEQTAQVPKGALAVLDLNYDNGDPDLWRPWRVGRVGVCH